MRINELQDQICLNVDKVKVVSSETTIKYLEEDITKLEAEIAALAQERQQTKKQEPTNMDKMKKCDPRLVGREYVSRWNPLLTDFILIGQKLENLGLRLLTKE